MADTCALIMGRTHTNAPRLKTPGASASPGRGPRPRCWALPAPRGPPSSRVGAGRWAGPPAAGAASRARRSLEGAGMLLAKAPPPHRSRRRSPTRPGAARSAAPASGSENSAPREDAGSGRDTPGRAGPEASDSQRVGAGRGKGANPSRPLRVWAPRVHLYAPGTLRSGRAGDLGRADSLRLAPGRPLRAAGARAHARDRPRVRSREAAPRAGGVGGPPPRRARPLGRAERGAGPGRARKREASRHRGEGRPS